MIDLPPHDRKRLADLLGRLGSDQPGERDVAATMLEKFRQEHDFIWGDVITPAVVQPSSWLPYHYQGINMAFHSHAEAQRFANLIKAGVAQSVQSAQSPTKSSNKPIVYSLVGFLVGGLLIPWLGWGGVVASFFGVMVWSWIISLKDRPSS